MPRDFMPILRHPEFRLPWALMVPHTAQALKNHGQTLERLAERGGLGFTEAYAILKDKDGSAVKHDAPAQAAARVLIERLIAQAGPVYVPIGAFVEDGGRWGKVSPEHENDPDVVILFRQRATAAPAPAAAPWWTGLPVPVVERVSALMRTIDAYAHDYQHDGKLGASRRNVERELAAALTGGAAT